VNSRPNHCIQAAPVGKGHREWFFGGQSGRWYKQSVVETFMRTNHPRILQQRWTSYAGTGRDIYGRKVSFGHGRP
jgi:hypothetical protein